MISERRFTAKQLEYGMRPRRLSPTEKVKQARELERMGLKPRDFFLLVDGDPARKCGQKTVYGALSVECNRQATTRIATEYRCTQHAANAALYACLRASAAADIKSRHRRNEEPETAEPDADADERAA